MTMTNQRITIGGLPHERIFTKAQVQGMLKEALEIVDELDPPTDLVRDVFSVAQQMLSQYVPIDNGIAKVPPTMIVPRG